MTVSTRERRKKCPATAAHDGTRETSPLSLEDIRQFALANITDTEMLRARIAEALHDDLGQTLMALNLNLYWLTRNCRDDVQISKRLIAMQQSIGKAGETVRKLAADIRPAGFRELSIKEILTDLVEYFRIEGGMSCETAVCLEDMKINYQYAISLYRLVQRILCCIGRCERATKVHLQADYDGHRLFMLIRDNGTTGYETSHQNSHIAEIVSIRRWVLALQGEFYADGRTGQGGTITIILPLIEDKARFQNVDIADLPACPATP